MTVKFWPSLKIIANARVAQLILYTFDLEILKHNFLTTNFVQQEYIQQIAEKVYIVAFHSFQKSSPFPPIRTQFEIMQSVLPTYAQMKLLGVVMTMGLEIVKWFVWHKSILTGDNLHLRKRLVWFSFGIIDRFQTAKKIIEDNRYNSLDRFILACKYYFEEEAQTLWARLSIERRNYVAKYFSSTKSMQLWLEFVNSNNSLNWEQISLNENNDYFIRNYLGIRYFFTKLQGTETRYECITTAIAWKRIHHFDLYFCLSAISNDELNALLVQLSEPKLYEVFECFLNWPFHDMFLDVVETYQRYMTGNIFRRLVYYIMYNKILLGWRDYSYKDLFAGFWNLMSPMYASYVNDNKFLLDHVKDVLERY